MLVPRARAHGLGVESPADAGIVHEDVELAELGDGGGDHLLPRRLARHVEVGVGRAGADAGGDGLALGLQDVGCDDPSPARTSATTTLAPSLAKISASLLPMPLAAPVISATLPWSLMAVSSSPCVPSGRRGRD